MVSVVSTLQVPASELTSSVDSILLWYVYSIFQSIIPCNVTYWACACAIIATGESQASYVYMFHAEKVLSCPDSRGFDEVLAES